MFSRSAWSRFIPLLLLIVTMAAVVGLAANTVIMAQQQMAAHESAAMATTADVQGVNTAAGLPAGLMPALAQSLANDLPVAWRARVLPGQGAELFNPAQHLRLRAANGDVRLSLAHGNTLGLRLTAVASGGQVKYPQSEPVTTRGTRIEIRHGHGLREWFVNSPLGIEQGFTLEHPLAAHRNSTELRFKLSGSLRPVLAGGALGFEDARRRTVLHYGELLAYDAHHRRLPARLSLEGETLSLQVDTRAAVYPVVIDPLFSATEPLTEVTPVSGHQFGYAVALSTDGTVALIGAPGANKAYVFTYVAKQWTPTATLPDPGANSGDKFGAAVALSANGTKALIGAPGADKAYLFSSAAWNTAAQVFDDPQGSAGDNFGGSVALSPDGSAALIGARNATAYSPPTSTKAPAISAGRAYAYSSVSWSDPAVFQEPTPLANAWFGFTVALTSTGSADIALIGSPQATVFVPSATSPSAPATAMTFAGAAYVYKFSYSKSKGWSSGTSSPTQSLAEPAPAVNDQFGYAVSLSSDGDAGLIGAPYAAVIPQSTTHSVAAAGKAYLYTGGSWSNPVEFDNPDATGTSVGVSAENAYFGFSVALAADNSGAVIGAPGAAFRAPPGSSSVLPPAVSDAGKVFAYSRTRGSWPPQATSLTSPQAFPDPATSANDQFGSSVASAALSSASVPVVDGLAGGPLLSVKPSGAATVTTAGSVLAMYTSDDVSLAMTATTSPVAPGNSISYFLTVTNNDAKITATNLVLTDTLPGSVSNITTGDGGGNCSNTGGTVTCTLASLKPNKTWQPSITVKAPAARTTLVNSAAVSADQVDTGTAALNNTASVSTTVAQLPAANSGTLTAYVTGSGTLTGSVGAGLTPSYSLTTQATNGTVTLNSNGSYTYTAKTSFLNTLSAVCGGSAGSSGTDSFQFTVSDGTYTSGPATVTVTVYPGPTACAVNGAASPVAHGTTPVTGQLQGLDPDPAKVLTYGVTSQPGHGTVTVTSGGAYTYTPGNYTGPDIFTFSVSDAHGNLSTAAVSITDYAAPTVSNGAFTVHGSTSSTPLELTGTEPDPGQIPTINVTAQPSHGTIAVGTVSVNQGVFTVPFTYTSTDPGFTGTDSFSFSAQDAYNTSNTGTVTLTVYTPPVANDGALTAHVSASGTLTATESDPTQQLVYTVTTPPTHGKLATFNSTTGAFTYQADAGYSGPDDFQFNAKDIYATSNTATISITDFAAPVASNGSLTVHTAASGTLVATDPDQAQTLTYGLVTQPAHGVVTLNAATGAYIYKSTAGYTGADSFSFNATDVYNPSNTATVNITAYAAPVANKGSLVAHGSASGTLAASDPDSNQTLTYAVVKPPAHGTVNLDAATGAYTYSATAGYTGTDSFTFNAKDSYTTSNTAVVTLTVYAIPAAADATLVVHGSGSGKLSATESDAQQTLGYAIVTGPAHGQVSLDAATGSYTYTTNAGFTGSDSFTFNAKDGYHTSNTATISVTAYGSPTAAGGTLTTSGNRPAQGQVRASDPDPNQVLAYVVMSPPAHGSLSLDSASGAFVYTPASGYSGSDNFSYAVKDAYATSNTATVAITIAAASGSGGSGGGTPQASGPPAAVAPSGGGALGWLGLLLLAGVAVIRRRQR